jgi:hypothetical protein
VLDTIGGRVIVSIDAGRYEDFVENFAMDESRETLKNRYSESKKSGTGMKI